LAQTDPVLDIIAKVYAQGPITAVDSLRV